LRNAKSPSAPKLSTEARQWWKRLTTEFSIEDDAGRLILQTALESFDRMRACQAAIERNGATFTDRFSQPRPHPLLSTERDARAAMLSALKQLNLDLAPLNDRPGRPGGS